MSLYGRADAKQGTALDFLKPALDFLKPALDFLKPPPGIPVWLLAIAGYLALVTLMHEALLLRGERGYIIEAINDGRLWLVIRDIILQIISVLLPVAVLILFVYRRYTLCIYYLIVAKIAIMALTFTSIAQIYDLHPYSHFLQDLQLIPNIPRYSYEYMVGFDPENINDIYMGDNYEWLSGFYHEYMYNKHYDIYTGDNEEIVLFIEENIVLVARIAANLILFIIYALLLYFHAKTSSTVRHQYKQSKAMQQ
jgi:hypothetical protein